MRRCLLLVLIVLLGAATAEAAPDSLPPRWQQVAHDVLKDIVNVNTAQGGEGTTKAAQVVAEYLRRAGFADSDMSLAGPDPKNLNLIVRFHGTRTSARPMLQIAHLDTVTANKADWTTDPFVFTEKDGWWYGRGIVDDKSGVGTIVTSLVRWKQEGFTPSRDIVSIITSAEETDAATGMGWIVANRPDLIDAEFCLNTDAGGGDLEHGKPVVFSLSAAEKVYQSYRVETTNPGGHSSLPRPDNAIYQLAAALTKIAAYRFPAQLTEISRQSLLKAADIHGGQEGADMRAVAANPGDEAAVERLSRTPGLNSMLRTTCVATRIEGGHADNALPQRATAIVNCRILPGVDPASVQQELARVIGDAAVTIQPVERAHPSPPTPLNPAIVGPIEDVVRAMWNVPVVPIMESGASDGLFLRVAGVPTYGIAGLFEDSEDIRDHGRDERIDPQRYYDAVAFWDRVVRVLLK
jgi:acetylornithine deacetylase/succinyl-diaminopimelate desuccinylase-like protein